MRADKFKKPRDADYSLVVDALPFEPVGSESFSGTCANIKEDLGLTGFYDMVESPYLLARLCALFDGLKVEAYGQESYKVTWQTALKHKETGHILAFYDYKGGASLASSVYGKNAPDKFLSDAKNLIEALVDDRCPHPYDGCCVGEIA